MIDLRRVFKKNEDVLEKQVEGAFYLVDPYRRVFMELNEAGSQIWRLLDGSRSLSDIITALKESFDAEHSDIQRDVLSFARALEERELVI
ncbi:MAG: PqqD family protein [Candidatus Omnitrophica bacterium]|nr:PqqD family protein [Candidatus Omnitrophota bacterium]